MSICYIYLMNNKHSHVKHNQLIFKNLKVDCWMIDLSNKPLQCIINICTLHRKEPKKGQDRTNLNITCKFWISVVIILATLCCDKLMESDLELSSILLTYTLQKNPHTPWWDRKCVKGGNCIRRKIYKYSYKFHNLI